MNGQIRQDWTSRSTPDRDKIPVYGRCSGNMLNIGVLASHQGTNFQAIVDACAARRLNARVTLLICNNANAPVLTRAERANVPFIRLSSVTHPDPAQLDTAICDALGAAEADLVILAGYMKKLGPKVLNAFENRIINVHPSLLPRFGGQGFYGSRVHEAVLAAGDTTTGASVHLVTAGYDEGAVLLQQEIPVSPEDTADSLAARLHPIEHELLIQATEQFAREKHHDKTHTT